VITTGERCAACRTSAATRCSSSPTADIQRTSSPISRSARAMCVELVSEISPSSSSLPMAMSSACM